jgi:hypothetical protein
MLVLSIGKHKNMAASVSTNIVNALVSLPAKLEETLGLANSQLEKLSK